MEITLQKIDLIRERTGLNYAEARELLEEAHGDVVEALVILDDEDQEVDMDMDFDMNTGDMKEMVSENVIAPVKRVFNKGNRTRIRVSNADGTLMEIPATLGIAGALLAPRATALSAVALLMANYSLDVEAPVYNAGEWQKR
jgi:NACalpha-BTF3-like transcription factor